MRRLTQSYGEPEHRAGVCHALREPRRFPSASRYARPVGGLLTRAPTVSLLPALHRLQAPGGRVCLLTDLGDARISLRSMSA